MPAPDDEVELPAAAAIDLVLARAGVETPAKRKRALAVEFWCQSSMILTTYFVIKLDNPASINRMWYGSA